MLPKEIIDQPDLYISPRMYTDYSMEKRYPLGIRKNRITGMFPAEFRNIYNILDPEALLLGDLELDPNGRPF